MVNNLSKEAKSEKGFTLIELLIALFISSLILTAIVSLYITSIRTFQSVKDVSDVKEIGKSGMAQMEWLFQRWGTSTPTATNNASSMSVAVSCQDGSGNYTYPPPSMVCMTITSGSPCDEAQFYANLSGNGFVHIPTLANSSVMNIRSCRLSTSNTQNCYHIKMGALFLRTTANVPVIFSLSNLSSNNIDCADGTTVTNATVSANATALNGNLLDPLGNLTTTYTFEGGEILLRVPHRIRLYCQANASDRNQNWLYMQTQDMAPDCNDNEQGIPLIPVNSFRIRTQGEGVVVNMQVRGTEGRTMNMERYFAR